MHKAGLFSLNFAWSLLGRDSPGIWSTDTERPDGAIRPVLMEVNLKIAVPRSSLSHWIHLMVPPLCARAAPHWTYTCRSASRRVKPQLNTTAHGHHHRRVITRRHISILVMKRGRDVSSLWKTRRALPPQRFGDHLCVHPSMPERN